MGRTGLNEAQVRCQCVGPTIPDSPNAVTSDDAVQASVAVLSMNGGNGDPYRRSAENLKLAA
jgi:hypothetical protein